MLPELSVIIPTYKRTASLAKLLDCINAQENIQLEVIVVDQNPTGFFDECLSGKLTKVIRIIQAKPNASLARNTGFSKATAPFILFLDDDLVPDPDFCKKGLDIFRTYPLIKCFVPLVFSQQGEEFAFSNSKKKIIEYYPGDKSIFSITDAISAAVFFESSYFRLTGGFDINLFEFARSSEDMELFLRMRKRNLVLWFVPFLKIFHDENVAGGCELRTSEYWVSRQKNIKAMAYRLRIHNTPPGKFSFINFIDISRSFVINKEVMRSGLENISKEVKLLLSAIKQSKIYYLKHNHEYTNSSTGFIEE